MKRTVSLIVVVVLFTLLIQVPAALLAQDEVTLEDVMTPIGELAEIETIAQAVIMLAQRVERLEAILEPTMTSGGVCVQYARLQLQRESRTKYLDAFGEDIDGDIVLQSVHYDSVNRITIYYFTEEFQRRSITEAWRGCEFLSVGEWVEERHRLDDTEGDGGGGG